MDRTARFIAEGQHVRGRIPVRRIFEFRHVGADSGGHRHIAARTPLILRVTGTVPDIQRLQRLCQAGQIHPTDLEASRSDRRNRPVGIGQRVVGVRVEIGEGVVLPRPLRTAAEEHVVRMVLLHVRAEGPRVLLGELRQVVLNLEGAVAQLVIDRERLKAKRRVGRAAFEDVDEREHLSASGAALILIRVTGLKRVRHALAEHAVPLADSRTDVFENLIIRVLKIQESGAVAGTAPERRAGARRVHVGERIQVIVAEGDFIGVVDVVIAAHQEPFGRRVLRHVFERAGLVIELRREK